MRERGEERGFSTFRFGRRNYKNFGSLLNANRDNTGIHSHQI